MQRCIDGESRNYVDVVFALLFDWVKNCVDDGDATSSGICE